METDWQGRSRREAAAIISEAMSRESAVALFSADEYSTMISLVAIGWLQGVNYGTHETLAEVERAFLTAKASAS